MIFFFFFNDTATPEIYTLSLHDALPILCHWCADTRGRSRRAVLDIPRGDDVRRRAAPPRPAGRPRPPRRRGRSEEHTSELQSRQYLVCRLLLEKKKTYNMTYILL